MKTQEIQINRFLREDLGMNPKYKVYDTLKDMIARIDVNQENKRNILTSNAITKQAVTRRILYYIETNHKSDNYKEIIGHNQKVTAKEFVVMCYEYYAEKYN